MERSKTPADDARQANRRTDPSEDAEQRRRESQLNSATRPSSGATIPQALAGMEMAAEGRADETSETAESLKRAAENDGRV